ncbi:MAG: hypothetical protein IT181_10955, partial [Acidobacteria bacterium]|nr:hypothetical protein [Acidobacteriota bacterium]
MTTAADTTDTTQAAAAGGPPAELRGLDDATAQARLREDGPNLLPRAARRTPLRIVGDVVREPMLALL